MKVHPQCNPAVGRMFFEGSKRLLASDVSILPVRINDSRKIVIEAYPRLVADKFSPGCKYKDGKNLDDCRDSILHWLSMKNPYGIRLEFPRTSYRDRCVTDHSGDAIDSVLCAVQAAWSWCVEAEEAAMGVQRRSHRFGIPTFNLPCLHTQVGLEGWIVDPMLLDSSRPKNSGHDKSTINLRSK
jgi:hypothetical protein